MSIGSVKNQHSWKEPALMGCSGAVVRAGIEPTGFHLLLLRDLARHHGSYRPERERLEVSLLPLFRHRLLQPIGPGRLDLRGICNCGTRYRRGHEAGDQDKVAHGNMAHRVPPW